MSSILPKERFLKISQIMKALNIYAESEKIKAANLFLKAFGVTVEKNPLKIRFNLRFHLYQSLDLFLKFIDRRICIK